MLEDALTWLNEVRREEMSRTVVYRRGDDSVELPATPAASERDSSGEQSVVMEWDEVEWLVGAADLKFDGQPVTPERGDYIDDGTERYQVLSRDGLPPWRWSGTPGRMMLILTKRIGQAEE